MPDSGEDNTLYGSDELQQLQPCTYDDQTGCCQSSSQVYINYVMERPCCDPKAKSTCVWNDDSGNPICICCTPETELYHPQEGAVECCTVGQKKYNTGKHTERCCPKGATPYKTGIHTQECCSLGGQVYKKGLGLQACCPYGSILKTKADGSQKCVSSQLNGEEKWWSRIFAAIVDLLRKLFNK